MFPSRVSIELDQADLILIRPIEVGSLIKSLEPHGDSIQSDPGILQAVLFWEEERIGSLWLFQS